MAPTKPRPPGLTAASGQRSRFRYIYGNHFWIPEVQSGWSKGMVRDTAREAIPDGAAYDSADFLLHQPGVAQKRGGTNYAGPALSGSSYVTALVSVALPTPALLAIGSNGHLYNVGLGTDLGALAGTGVTYVPFAVSPGAKYAVIALPNVAGEQKYDGAAISTLGVGIGLSHIATYKSRLLGNDHLIQNRVYFSQTPDVNATWDATNSWIDFDNQISGFAAINTALLVFSAYGMERIIGATPPPNSDMDRAPVSPIGCTDCRSIVQVGPNVFFANPEGVYLTNGSTPVSLTEQGGIATYWRSLFSGYVSAAPVPTASTWTIAAGWYRGFLFVSVLNASRVLQATLMCNISTRAWWRLTNVNAMCYASSLNGIDMYYGDASSNYVIALSQIFSPAAANKNDANGTAVTPTIEFAPFGRNPGVKSYGFARLDYDLRDAASDNPTLAVTAKGGIEADTSWTPAESPALETTTLGRKRYMLGRDAQAVTISVAQTNASAKTEIYALEVENRPQSMVGDGVS